jgi:hypothetical protein
MNNIKIIPNDKNAIEIDQYFDNCTDPYTEEVEAKIAKPKNISAHPQDEENNEFINDINNDEDNDYKEYGGSD